jgi:hypothetical protein
MYKIISIFLLVCLGNLAFGLDLVGTEFVNKTPEEVKQMLGKPQRIDDDWDDHEIEYKYYTNITFAGIPVHCKITFDKKSKRVFEYSLETTGDFFDVFTAALEKSTGRSAETVQSYHSSQQKLRIIQSTTQTWMIKLDDDYETEVNFRDRSKMWYD